MIAYVRLILNQYDQEAFRRVANVPKRSIGPASVDAILKYVEENPDADIFDACENVKLRNRKAQMGINNFVAVIEELYITANEINQNLDGQATLADLIRRIVILTDYEKHLNDTVKNKDEVTQRMSNVYELMNIASNYTDIEEFVDNMMGYSDEDEEDEEGQATVKMLTMHASKGLEWPIVIIVGCNEGTSPHFLSIRDGNLEAERRLFYVAMTRAKKQLFLSRAKFVRDRSGIPHATHESRFISEIDSRYINKR
jgi:DNA helicase-2/ATP-dependent DNA helicase PcrA